MNERSQARKAPPRKEATAFQSEVSEKTAEGWDKYYFFSDPANKSIVHKTARLGRNRPACNGPQTFMMGTFSQEDLRAADNASKSLNTTYGQSFSQIPRSRSVPRLLPEKVNIRAV